MLPLLQFSGSSSCAPFGIMGLIFSTISEQGLDALLSYGKLILVLVGSMAVVIFIINPIIVFIFTKQNPFPVGIYLS